MQYIKIDKPSLIKNKIPILLFSNFIEPSDSERDSIYKKILEGKENWKKENNWVNYMSSYGVPGELSFSIESNEFLDDVYKKFIFTSNQFLRLNNANFNGDIIKIRCLNSYDPHYVWNSILEENEKTVIGMYCFYSEDDETRSVQIDFEYREKLFSYTFKQNDLLIFPRDIDYAIRPPLTNKYQVIFNLGIQSISNTKKIFINYI